MPFSLRGKTSITTESLAMLHSPVSMIGRASIYSRLMPDQAALDFLKEVDCNVAAAAGYSAVVAAVLTTTGVDCSVVAGADCNVAAAVGSSAAAAADSNKIPRLRSEEQTYEL